MWHYEPCRPGSRKLLPSDTLHGGEMPGSIQKTWEAAHLYTRTQHGYRSRHSIRHTISHLKLQHRTWEGLRAHAHTRPYLVPHLSWGFTLLSFANEGRGCFVATTLQAYSETNWFVVTLPQKKNPIWGRCCCASLVTRRNHFGPGSVPWPPHFGSFYILFMFDHMKRRSALSRPKLSGKIISFWWMCKEKTCSNDLIQQRLNSV